MLTRWEGVDMTRSKLDLSFAFNEIFFFLVVEPPMYTLVFYLFLSDLDLNLSFVCNIEGIVLREDARKTKCFFSGRTSKVHVTSLGLCGLFFVVNLFLC